MLIIGSNWGQRQSARRGVWKVHCDKTADWSWMLFGVVSGVGLGMGVLDGGGDCQRGRGSLGVNFGCPIITNGAFETHSSQITLRTFHHMRYVYSVSFDIEKSCDVILCKHNILCAHFLWAYLFMNLLQDNELHF